MANFENMPKWNYVTSTLSMVETLTREWRRNEPDVEVRRSVVR